MSLRILNFDLEEEESSRATNIHVSNLNETCPERLRPACCPPRCDGKESLEPGGAAGSSCGLASCVLVAVGDASAEVTLISVTWMLTAEEERPVR